MARYVEAAESESLSSGGVPAIAVHGVSKTFRLPHQTSTTVKDRLLHPLAHGSEEALAALHDVTFDVRHGEFFGVLGQNGSGKSTLLRCIAGIYPVDTGTVEVHGRLAPFIELGVGFNPELTARDNAIANAVVFGLSRAEATERIDEMFAFAELERFVDQKLKNYSSGMSVRLAFAVTVHVEADVLLFDEVLAVGDAAFKQKCFTHFEHLRNRGKTVVLVTHDTGSVERFCDRALLLHRGELVGIGEPAEVAESYQAINAGEPPPTRPRGSPPARAATAAPERPRLLGGEPRRFLSLVRLLALTDFKLKYMDSALSYVWAVARPLALFGAMYVIFTSLGRFGEDVRHYPAYLFLGIVLWTFFAQATDGAVWSLVRRGNFLRKLPFPHLAAPLSHITTSLLDLAANLVAVIALALALGVVPGPAWLELLPIVALLAAFATGFALLLSAVFVRHRDLHQIWSVLLQATFFCTPLFYPVSSLPAPWDRVMMLVNPIAAMLTEARHAVIDPAAPSAASVAGGWPFLLVPVGIVLAVLALGLLVFRRESPRAAENV